MGCNYEFCSSVRFCYAWNSLKYKYENKMTKEEFYLYQTLVDQVSSLALKLDLNYKLCEALAYVHSFTFPDYGKASWNVVFKYLENNKLAYNINDIKLEITKRKIKSVYSAPEDSLYNYVDEMFSNNVVTKEVKIVIECYRIIKLLQPLKEYDLNLFFSLIDEAIDELKENYLKSNDICSINMEKYIPLDMPKLSNELDGDIFNDLYTNLSDSVKLFNGKYQENTFYENLILSISYYINE